MQSSLHIAGRYRVVRTLGKGGTAIVHEVVDETTGDRLALKQVSSEHAEKPHVVDLFRREFNALLQLSHPLVVRVFDYGVDGTPYYTMQLLTGKPLRGPLPWRKVCGLLRDVASALSLVHSRRLVHRDVTHRNVYETDDGHAMLFDFGALSPMGPTTDVVGTPPFMAPETVGERRLDARSDLFSLGALGYVLLTGRHAYPARRLSELGEAWRRTVELPSRFSADVPRALDELVVSLLSVEPVARPASAAEVFDRLTAIADLPSGEAPEVAAAYLTTPALAGRRDVASRFKAMLSRVRPTRGASVVIEARSGMGRSRVLSTLLLDAKIDGFVALAASGGDGERRPFFAAAALVRELVEADGVLARDAAGAHAEVLAPLVFDSTTAPAVAESRTAELVEAFSSMLTTASKQRRIIVGIDDFERVDAPSKLVIVRLSEASRHCPIALVVAALEDEDTNVHALLRRSSSAMALPPLSEQETHELVSSLFGHASETEAVSQWVHRLSEGNPRTALEVAAHLVDTGVAVYEDGAWILPRSLEGLVLPESIGQALDAKIAALSSDSRALAEALALASELEPLRSSEYGVALDGISAQRIDLAINDLVSRSTLVPSGATFTFVHESVRDAVRRAIPDERRKALHLRLARAYESGAEPSAILSAHHFLAAGDEAGAFERAALSASQRGDIAVRGSVFSRAAKSIRSYERLFAWGLEHKKPWRKIVDIGRFLLRLAAVSDMSLVRHRSPILERLRLDTGLADWERMVDVKDPLERIRSAVGAAIARYEATPAADRGVEPIAAISDLTVTAVMLTGVFSRRMEPLEIAPLRAWIEPFRPLSPAVEVASNLLRFSFDSLLARDVQPDRARLIDSLSRAIPGFDEIARTGMCWAMMYYHAMEEACRGRPEAAMSLEALAEHPAYAPLAWQARFVAALYQGDLAGAAHAKRQRDLARLAGSSDIDAQLENGRAYEASAYDAMGELLQLKECLPWFERRARSYPEVRGYYELHLGNYHRHRGEHEKALAALERASAIARGPGAHGAWAQVATRRAQVLLELGHVDEAKEIAARTTELARTDGTVPQTYSLVEVVLARCEAVLGAGPLATKRAEAVVAEFQRRGLRGVMLARLFYEAGLVAQAANDDALVNRAIERLEELGKSKRGMPFATKHAHLLRASRGRGGFEVAESPYMTLSATVSTQTSLAVGVRTQIEECRGLPERAEKALRILLDGTASSEGYLYLCRPDGLKFAASSTHGPAPVWIEEELGDRLRLATAEDVTTGQGESNVETERPKADEEFEIVEITSESGGKRALSALAVLRSTTRRLTAVSAGVRTAISDAFIRSGDTAGVPWG